MTTVEQHIIAEQERRRQKSSHLRQKFLEETGNVALDDYDYMKWIEERYIELADCFEEINEERLHLIVENMKLKEEIK